MAVHFELRGALGAALEDLGMGPWRHRTTSAQVGPQSFAASYDQHTDDQPPVWSVDIGSGDLAHIHVDFDRGARSVAHARASIDNILERISNTLEHPDVADASQAPEAEAELLETMSVLRQAPLGQSAGPVSFGSDDSGWRAMAEKARTALSGIERMATYPTWVETRVFGQLVARTGVTWLGDTENLATPNLQPALIELHRRAVATSLQTRNAWTRLLVTVVHGSARIAATIGPGGSIKALPIAWSFTRRVLAEVKYLRTVRAG